MATIGVHAHANNTNEQTVFENTDAVDCIVPGVSIDVSGLAKNTTLRLYHKIDGTNYRLLGSWEWNSGMDDGIYIQGPFIFYNDFKLTMQSGATEGGVVNCPYYYIATGLPATQEQVADGIDTINSKERYRM